MSTSEPLVRPVVLEDGQSIDFDPDDVDGRYVIFDRDWRGAILVTFSVPMSPRFPGVVLLDGHPIRYTMKPVTAGSDSWRLGVRLFGVLTEPGRRHSLEIKGFRGADGTPMEPAKVSVATRRPQTRDPRYAAHDRLAQKVAEDGIVLLKNEAGTLPLQPGVLNVLGSGLDDFRASIIGAGKINPRYTVRLRQAIDNHEGFELNEELADFHRKHGDAVPDVELLKRARNHRNLGIVVISRASGENFDNTSARGDFMLTFEEEKLVQASAEAFAQTVAVLNTPYPIDVRALEAAGVDAIVFAGIGGMFGGPALLNVLGGAVNPSGRLPDTWPLSLADLPAHRNFYDAVEGRSRLSGDAAVWIDTVYEEGIYIGYRYFTTFRRPVAFAFGHGLSYTSFKVDPGAITVGPETLVTQVRVQNSGPVSGREVVQAYIHKPAGNLEQPERELVAFAKTPELQPGESCTLEMAIPSRRLASFDESASAWIIVDGEYELHIGHSVARTTEAGRVVLAGHVVEKVPRRLTPTNPINALSRQAPEFSWPRGLRSGVKPGVTAVLPARDAGPKVFGSSVTEPPHQRDSFSAVQKDPTRVEAYVAKLSVQELARLTVCAQSGWGLESTGIAGIVARPAELDIPVFQVADGNSGINVKEPNIGFPATVVLSSTFDIELATAVGRAIGEEARELDVDLILAPALNLHRHPLNGRHPEYFSEDPVLAGVMAGHYAQGLESSGVGACYKHFAANNTETARKRNQSLVPVRALRELYLRAFEVALSIYEPVAIMSAYNAINGRSAAADPHLLDGVLRQDFAFTGFIMTDWWAYDTCDIVDAIAAGTNWITPGSTDDSLTEPIVAAVTSGRLSESQLRESVSRLLTVVARLTKHRADGEGTSV